MSAGIRDRSQATGEEVFVTVPPFSAYLRTVRLVAADAAVRAGLDYEEVEDFRIAVDELCHLLMASTDHEIDVSFAVAGRHVVARGRARRRQGHPRAQLNDLPRMIIQSLADHHEVVERDDELTFLLRTETARRFADDRLR